MKEMSQEYYVLKAAYVLMEQAMSCLDSEKVVEMLEDAQSLIKTETDYLEYMKEEEED